MEVKFERENGLLKVLFEGRLDTNTSPQAEENLFEKIDAGEKFLIIDLEQTQYISSAGLRVLFKATKRIKLEQGKLCLCQANQQNLEVLKISGFLTIMNYFPSLTEAMEYHLG